MKVQPLRMGQVAQRSGVSTDTIRHYERIALMPKPGRSAAGYREYSDTAIHRVRLIQNSLRFGFSLKQLQSFLGTPMLGACPANRYGRPERKSWSLWSVRFPIW